MSALLDNHIHQGNALGIDQRRIIWKRVVDLNDRALRHVTVGLGGPLNGIPREDGFDITVASEIMAILCLATDINDLKERLANIVVAYRYDRTPVYVRGTDNLWHTSLGTWWSICQHRSRMQLSSSYIYSTSLGRLHGH